MRILLVEDEKLLLLSLRDTLAEAAYKVETAPDAEKAWGAIQAAPPHMVIADVRLPGMSGTDLLLRIRAKYPAIAVLLMTTFASVKDAVEALKAGAQDYLVKPFEGEELLERVARVAAFLELRSRTKALEEQIDRMSVKDAYFGFSGPMAAVVATVERVRDLDVDVLIAGETGTGKEVMARAIHEGSRRARGPFVPVSCSALSAGLLENELFGHERGAFTGANARMAGRLEAASGGTLYLDDADDIPLEIQPKLLRVLQERMVERLGSTHAHPVDFRLVASTKKDLKGEADAGRFRPDLYYRLKGVEISLPPLRERPEDVLPLSALFIRRHHSKAGALPSLHPDSALILQCHTWPGNVRELEQAVRHALALCDGPVILPAHMPRELNRLCDAWPLAAPCPDGPVVLDDLLLQIEARLVDWAMTKAGGKQSQAAELLGMKRTTLQYRIQRTKGAR